jgi:hypothetical protein
MYVYTHRYDCWCLLWLQSTIHTYIQTYMWLQSASPYHTYAFVSAFLCVCVCVCMYAWITCFIQKPFSIVKTNMSRCVNCMYVCIHTYRSPKTSILISCRKVMVCVISYIHTYVQERVGLWHFIHTYMHIYMLCTRTHIHTHPDQLSKKLILISCITVLVGSISNIHIHTYI